jgi:tRNA pseudouridine55 synthase
LLPFPLYDFEAGEVLLFDKPLEWTSFDVVKKVRNAVHQKVGHAGTLDPLATGLLIVCTGKKTKQIDTLMAQEKEYLAEITLGATTPSYDKESPPDATFPTEHITSALIEEALAQFRGPLLQLPPMFSAVSVGGERLYKLARRGETIERAPRPITIYELSITGLDLNGPAPTLSLHVVCSKGTYIRSLAHDIGKALQSGGYLSALRRTRIGDYRIEDAWALDTFVAHYRQPRPG